VQTASSSQSFSNKGYISKPIPRAKVTAFFEDAYFTPILKELIGYSARPLRVVMSTSDTGMVNEVLCKLLCHNLTCLIQEQETLGIVPVFWKDEEQGDGQGEKPDVLPLVRPG
jgi:hypothetical protein